MKLLSIILVILCLVPSAIWAHSFAIYVSTPVTPPFEFIWVFWVYASLFILFNFFIQRKFLGVSVIRSLIVSVGFLTCFILSFCIIGFMAAGANTGPPPGLGMPSQTYWGYGWEKAGGLFISWNFYGIIFLGFSGFIFLKPWSVKSSIRWKAIFANLVLYFLCAMPYMSTGALLHGWAGGYVTNECEDRLALLNFSLIKYAEAHNNQLPEANDINALLVKIKPFAEKDKYFSLTRALLCPKGSAFEKFPKQYEWNSKFSGVKLQDINLEELTFDVELISCPYHKNMGNKYSFELIDKIKEAIKRKSKQKTESEPE